MEAVKTLSFETDQDKIKIYAISDIHIGSQFCDFKKIKQTIKEIEEQENAYVLLLGDIMDMTLKNSVGSVYENKWQPGQQMDEAVNMLYPIKDKIIGATEGNHEARMVREVDLYPVKTIMQRMGNQTLNNYSKGAFVLFVTIKVKGRPVTFSIYCKHGSGGGRKTGSKVNRMEEMAIDIVADVFISGHTHTDAFTSALIHVPDNRYKKLIPQKQMIVNSNNFLSWGGYGVEKGYSPNVTGCPTIELTAKRTHRTKGSVTEKFMTYTRTL